jgi:predicted GTPase
MNRRMAAVISAVFLLLLPTLVATAAGFVWLYEHGHAWTWLVGSLVCSLAGWAWLRALGKPRVAVSAQPPHGLPPLGQEAWKDVESIAIRAEQHADTFTNLEAFGPPVHEILVVVARRYNTKSDRPELEIPAPHALRIVELVARDLRAFLDSTVPLAHAITLNDVFRFRRIGRLVEWGYRAWRLGYFVWNPPAALLREAREPLGRASLNVVTSAVRRKAVGFVVRRAGSYVIDLYAGTLVLDEARVGEFESNRAQADAATIGRRGVRAASEPLRIVVVGQVKAGKSSVVNALLGDVAAAVDVVPCTPLVEPYVLRRDGIDRAIILDTAGHATATATPHDKRLLVEEIAGCDLVLVVCSATSAARGPDRELLDALRQWFQERPNRVPPPLVAVVTHVDLLRPRTQWTPPYNIAKPVSDKARSIRDAVDAVAADLGVDAGLVVPVCTAAGRVDNIDEALHPLIVSSLGEADRVRYLRCLREFRDAEFWYRLREQAAVTGRVVASTAATWLHQGMRSLDRVTRTLTDD